MKGSTKSGKLVYGVGVNDSAQATKTMIRVGGVQKQIWRCPYYGKWVNMLQRCYSELYHDKFPTYKDCTVCEEWKYFSKFKKWM